MYINCVWSMTQKIKILCEVPTRPDCSVMAEFKQDSNLTREKRRLELPLSSRLEVTRLEQVNLT